MALSLVVLVSILLPWKRHCRRNIRACHFEATNTDDVLESPAAGNAWVLPFRVFDGDGVLRHGYGFLPILFPPLIVIAYEMFAHPTACPWAGKPLALPAACVLMSAAGWGAVSLFGSDGVAAACGMAFGIVACAYCDFTCRPRWRWGFFPW